jgi:hypothetical protein
MQKPQFPEIEEVKRLNLVDFLSRHYGLDFSMTGAPSPNGSQYCCLSPFKEERNGSFFVREVNGHWLFKDFSSGHGGSLIDFVLLKEGLENVAEALSYIGRLLAGAAGEKTVGSSPPHPSRSNVRGYDVESLYHSLRGNDVGRCRDYLLSRGICQEVVDRLCDGGLLLHNAYNGDSYCCFAVFNETGQLRCLDNHQIGGDGKFVLGRKHPFSFDWEELPLSERVFVTESIIDYLSLKTLEGFDYRGLALLGNVLNFDSGLFSSAHEIVSALDGDVGGFGAFLDLEEKFSDRVLGVYDFGDSKDANEHLQKQNQRKKGNRLSAADKLLLYQDFQRSKNKFELASKWGLDRSYMYQIIKECEEMILSGFSRRRRGRKPSGQPETMAEACERLEKLETENRRLDEERERHWVRNEFMKVRLKWAEHETDELRGQMESIQGNQSATASKNRRKHLKKKRREKL